MGGLGYNNINLLFIFRIKPTLSITLTSYTCTLADSSSGQWWSCPLLVISLLAPKDCNYFMFVKSHSNLFTCCSFIIAVVGHEMNKK